MPYKSEAQRGFFHANMGKKGITPAMVNEFDQASKGKKLPKKKARKKRKPMSSKMGGYTAA